MPITSYGCGLCGLMLLACSLECTAAKKGEVPEHSDTLGVVALQSSARCLLSVPCVG